MSQDLAKKAMKTLRNELLDYLTGKQSLQSFYDWFGPESTDVHLWAPDQVLDMVYTIKLLLAEYSSGQRSETDLRDQLLHLLILQRYYS